MIILYLMGGKRTGKDTFSNELNKYIRTEQISVVDKVKEIAKKMFGWDGEKDEKGRKLLSDLKDAWDTYNDGTILEVENWLERKKETNTKVACIQVREYHSIEKMKKRFGGFTVHIKRPLIVQTGVEKIKLNDYPKGWKADFTIYNTKGLDDYKKLIEDFASEIKLIGINVYLAGCVRETDYRKTCKNYKFKNNIVNFIDPLDYDKEIIHNKESYEKIIDRDLELIDKCDCLISYIREYTAGTSMEMMYAKIRDIPIYTILSSDKKQDIWIVGNSDKVFDTTDKCLEYLDK